MKTEAKQGASVTKSDMGLLRGVGAFLFFTSIKLHLSSPQKGGETPKRREG
jgi:hypothetical protein